MEHQKPNSRPGQSCLSNKMSKAFALPLSVHASESSNHNKASMSKDTRLETSIKKNGDISISTEKDKNNGQASGNQENPCLVKPGSSGLTKTSKKSNVNSNLRANNATNLNHLSNIIEKTQEYELQGKTIIMQSSNFNSNYVVNSKNINIGQNNKISKLPKSQSNNVVPLKNQQEPPINEKQLDSLSSPSTALLKFRTFLARSLNCIQYTCNNLVNLNPFRSGGSNAQANASINVQQSQISQMLSKLRSKKKNRKLSLLPELSITTLKGYRKTLVLDLQQTLIFTTFKKPNCQNAPSYKHDFSLKMKINSTEVILYGIKRFGLDSFLFQMSQMYELVIWSSSKLVYVEQIVRAIDPKGYISSVLGREHCLVINKQHYIKSIRDLGRQSKNIIVVDSHQISASLNLENLYKIDTFRGNTRDRKLVKLGYFLKYMHEKDKEKDELNHSGDEGMPIEMLRRRFQSMEIQIANQKSGRKSKQMHKQLIQQQETQGTQKEQYFIKAQPTKHEKLKGFTQKMKIDNQDQVDKQNENPNSHNDVNFDSSIGSSPSNKKHKKYSNMPIKKRNSQFQVLLPVDNLQSLTGLMPRS